MTSTKDSTGTTSKQWVANQVVWCRYSSEVDQWFPALVIDPEDQWVGLESGKEGFQHVLWLGDGRISQVPEADMRCFCLAFKDCYHKMANADKYQRAAQIAVKLAAARADETIDDDKWVEWAMNNLHQYTELSVSNSFYKALRPPDEDKDEDGNKRSSTKPKSKFKREETERRNSDSSCSAVHDDENQENLIYTLGWVRQEDSLGGAFYWPSLLTEQDQEGGLIRAELLRKGTKLELPKEEVLDFCAEFSDKIDEGRIENDGQYAMAVGKAIEAICTQNGAKCDEAKPIPWAKDNIVQYENTRLAAPVVNSMKEKLRPIRADLEGMSKIAKLPGSGQRARKSVKRTTGDDDDMFGDKSLKKKSKFAGSDSDSDLERSEMMLEKKKKKLLSSSMSSGGGSPVKRKIVKRQDIDIEVLKIPLDLGWIREVSMRKDQSKKMGDCYYHPPDGHKKLRSFPEVVRYLEANQGKRHTEGLDVATHFCYRETVRTEHENEKIRDALAGTNAFGKG